MSAYFDAARAGRWDVAARYLSLTDALRPRAAQLAERLKGVIDGTGWIELETVSASPSGRLDDGLPAELEDVTQIGIDGRVEPLRLLHTRDATGEFWAFSPATVERIDAWYADLPDRWLRDAIVYLGIDFLLQPGPYELLWWQWLAIPVLIAIAWGLGWVVGHATRGFLRRIAARTTSIWDDRFIRAIGPPITLFWSIIFFRIGAVQLVLTDPAYRFIGAVTRAVFMFALFWALWRASGVASARMTHLGWASGNNSARSLLAVGTNIIRAGIVVAGILAMLAALGYPVTTVLAGLGIGGLALAFGAQKTVENVFGSLALAVDQPFRVGDFVKVEDFVGTVEDIGLRSTRIRTLDRTLISIPNGKLSDQRLESFEVRDRMRLATTIGLTYDTTQQQMQTVLEGFKGVLRAHPDIWPDAMVVKFAGFGASSLDIEIMAWFQVPTWGDFQRCREEVLLGFMGVVEGADASFAFPTRTVHLVGAGPQPAEGPDPVEAQPPAATR
ncbi:MAG: mechanosensitive ion channel family protein [Vicinamibacterales bacterium]